MGTKEYAEATPSSSSKVSDSLATYTATPSTKSWKHSIPPHRIGGLEASDEVWQFAQKHQLIIPLEQTIRITRESFHDLGSLRLTFDPDPEIPNLDGIGVRAKLKSEDLEEWERQYRVFQERFLREVPHDSQDKICLFLGSV